MSSAKEIKNIPLALTLLIGTEVLEQDPSKLLLMIHPFASWSRGTRKRNTIALNPACQRLTLMMYSCVSATTEENSTRTAWGSSDMMAAVARLSADSFSSVSTSCCSQRLSFWQPPGTNHTLCHYIHLYPYREYYFSVYCLRPFARMCRLRVPCSAKPRAHFGHLKGFSPVWWRMCRTREPFSLKPLKQNWHT